MLAYGGVGNLVILDGNVEVNANENALPFEIEVLDGELVGERHGLR